MAKQESTPYDEAYVIIKNLAEESGREVPFIEKSKLIEKLELTPGQFYSARTTWDEVFENMTAWNWLTRVDYKGKIYYVPTKEDS